MLTQPVVGGKPSQKYSYISFFPNVRAMVSDGTDNWCRQRFVDAENTAYLHCKLGSVVGVVVALRVTELLVNSPRAGRQRQAEKGKERVSGTYEDSQSIVVRREHVMDTVELTNNKAVCVRRQTPRG